MGVFGNPITDETLKGLPEYEGKRIGALDRARVSLRWKNAEGKDARALEFAENLKASCDKLENVHIVTLCLIYNATGGTLEHVDYKDWEGHCGASPYPIIIQNGQWGVFLHRKGTNRTTGSVGAVVYRSINAENRNLDWMLAWGTSPTQGKSAYTEIRQINGFNASSWNDIGISMGISDIVHKVESNGCLSYVSIGQDNYCIFRAILTLKNANKKN